MFAICDTCQFIIGNYSDLKMQYTGTCLWMCLYNQCDSLDLGFVFNSIYIYSMYLMVCRGNNVINNQVTRKTSVGCVLVLTCTCVFPWGLFNTYAGVKVTIITCTYKCIVLHHNFLCNMHTFDVLYFV